MNFKYFNPKKKKSPSIFSSDMWYYRTIPMQNTGSISKLCENTKALGF